MITITRHHIITHLLVFASILFFFGTTNTALADDMPRFLSYQGQLEYDGGSFTGSLEMTFALYPSSTDETPLWKDNYTVHVTNGSFSVKLGNGNEPLTPNVWAAESLYVGISIEGTPLSGRQRLGAAAFAFRNVPGSAFKIGESASPCNSTTEGSLRYHKNLRVMQFCNGSSWVSMVQPSEVILVADSECPAGYVSYEEATGRFLLMDKSNVGNTGGSFSHSHLVHKQGRSFDANGNFTSDEPHNGILAQNVSRYGVAQVNFTSIMGGVHYTDRTSTLPPYIRLRACRLAP